MHILSLIVTEKVNSSSSLTSSSSSSSSSSSLHTIRLDGRSNVVNDALNTINKKFGDKNEVTILFKILPLSLLPLSLSLSLLIIDNND